MGDINYSVICAVRNGDIERATQLFDAYGLSYSLAWSGGYVLLRDALKNNRPEMARLLLDRDARVNSKNKISSVGTPLYFAAKEGHLDIVEMLLDRGARINGTHMYDSPLHIAAENGHLQMVELLLKYGATQNTYDRGTPLNNAVQKGHVNVVKLLLKYGAIVDSVNFRGESPLYVAIESRNESLVKLLLECGANVNSKDRDGKSALYVAAQKGCENLVKLLLESGADVNSTDSGGKSPLYVVIERGNESLVKLLLEYKPDINDNSRALHVAVCKQYGLIVEYLLEYGFNIEREDANDYELLDAAIKGRQLGIVEQLLKYGADVNKSIGYDKCTLLHRASQSKVEGAINLLISYGANVNNKDLCGRTAIFHAARNGELKIFDLLLADSDISISDQKGQSLLHVTGLKRDECFSRFHLKDVEIRNLTNFVNNAKGEIAKKVLNRGANVNARDKYGNTPLHIAIKSEYMQVVETLLEHNADVDSTNRLNITPLHLSAEQGHYVITQMLLNKGADVNAKEKNGLTPLYKAVEGSRKNVVELLLECGANLDCIITPRFPPLLHCAVEQSCYQIIKSILTFGADVNFRDHQGNTALHIASKKGCEEIVSILLEYGADISITNTRDETALDLNKSRLESIRYINDYDDQYSDDDYDNEDDYSYGSIRQRQRHFEGFDSDDDDDSFKSINGILQCHIVKMATAGLYVSQRNLHARNNYSSEMNIFKTGVKEEISTIKAEIIPNTNISFYDILSKSMNLLVVYMRNEDIMSVLKPDYIEKKFPIYSSMLQDRVRRGVWRKDLLERSDRFIQFLCMNVTGLPLPCPERILSYLSNKELKCCIDAGELIM